MPIPPHANPLLPGERVSKRMNNIFIKHHKKKGNADNGIAF